MRQSPGGQTIHICKLTVLIVVKKGSELKTISEAVLTLLRMSTHTHSLTTSTAIG